MFLTNLKLHLHLTNLKYR
jgi:hypothetical protein